MTSEFYRRRSHSEFFALAVLALSLLACFPLHGQVTGGMLSGTVTDPSGGVLPKAKIVITNIATGVSRQAITDSAGFYTAPNLQPGSYQIAASATGFSTLVRSGITMTVGGQQVLNLVLQVGAVSQKVHVTAAPPIVQLSTSEITHQVGGTTVRELPLNGRDWTQLATLQPGVISMGSLQPGIGSGSGSARGNRGFGTQLTISGGRPEQNNYRIDGISVNDYDNSSPGDALGVALGVDSIQEFSVLASNYSAEYGRTSGGVINAITRSGTNSFHGDAYEFLRNSNLDAANFFDNFSNIQKPPFRRNQFGASVGGPIKKDKTFFFADYEGLRQALGVTNIDTVPSVSARNGIITNSNGTVSNITVDPKVAAFLPLWHVPNGPLLGLGNTGVYSFASNQIATENFFTTRLDENFSSKDSLSGVYRFDNSLATLPDVLNVALTGQHAAEQSVSIAETHIFGPTLLNSVRFGYNRSNDIGGYGISAINPAAADLSLGAIPGEDAPQTFVTGLTTLQGGVNDQNNTRFRWNSFQAYDDAFLTTGRNSLKFGVNVERDQNNVLQHSTVGGAYHFGSLVALLQNQPLVLTGTLPQTVSPRYLRQTIFGTYVQDDIRWRPSLTFNAGLRYEMSTVPIEKYNKLVDMPTPTATAPHIGSPLFSNPTLTNFEPRVGFAWDPFHNGKTSIRGGFGVFDVLPLLYEYSLTELQLYPFATTGRVSSLPQGSFPSGGFASLTASSTSSHVAYIQPNMPRDYVMQWNLNVQHQLAPNLALTVAYLGSHGVHQLFRGDDMNMVLPTLTAAGYLWPSPAGSGTVQNPNFGRIDVSTYNTNSSYNALEAEMTKQFSHGLRVQGSYTWSKCLDGGSGSVLGDPFSNSISNLFFFDTNFNYSLCDFNVAQSAVVNYTYDLPSPALAFAPARWALGGWELGGIFSARTGLPFSVLIGGDPLGTKSASPFDFPNHVSGPGCQSAVNSGSQVDYINLNCFAVPNPITLLGDAQRNSLIGPGLVDFDFSLIKNNYVKKISENFNVQFRAEFFNILNRANFNPPTDNEALFSQSGSPVGGAGLIDSTSATAREIQFALKIIW